MFSYVVTPCCGRVVFQPTTTVVDNVDSGPSSANCVCTVLQRCGLVLYKQYYGLDASHHTEWQTYVNTLQDYDWHNWSWV
jgi:hypothetical protein